MQIGMTELEFEKWKKDWYNRIPHCETFVCCHELMSCGIKIFCGDCSIFETYSRDRNPKECTTVGCDDCMIKYDCPDYGGRKIFMEEKKFRREDEKPLEIRKKESPREDIKKEFPRKDQTKKELPKKDFKKDDSLVKSFLNKDIVLMMRGGRKLLGKLETVSSYELLITVNYSPVIVLKHAVDYITLSDEEIKEIEPLNKIGK